MRWQGRRESSNVDDRRGQPGQRMVGGVGGGMGLLIMVAILWFSGADFGQILRVVLQQGPAVVQQQQAEHEITPEENELASFVKVVFADTEDVWNKVFQEQLNQQYREPTLVLFSQSTQSGCGYASSATGPFYCPADQKVYIDLSFYSELQNRFGAEGDFAQAYVIAHEVGHHVQRLTGFTSKVDSMRGRVSEEEQNQLSVRLELQADFLAGVWAHHAQQMKDILENGDLREAINAAQAIGDDRLQKQSQGYVQPDSFTHGTSEQRMKWFQKGYESGNMKDGNTFDVPYSQL
jgi:predicted metalloprotease